MVPVVHHRVVTISLASQLARLDSVKSGPQRIVCLTEEPTEFLCALGESDRIVGISAYTVRPAHIRDEKPIVSAFINGSVSKIAALKPDLVVGFSDIQADLAQKLIKAHLPVLIFNQRSVDEIIDMLRTLGRIVDAADKTEALIGQYRANIDQARARAATLKRRPRVYFEEWDDPMISGIHWVSELIEIAGGIDPFADQARGKGAVERQLQNDAVIDARPDIILASWCGKPVNIPSISARMGYDVLPAVQHSHVYELDPAIILQPGPAALTAGLTAICDIIHSWAEEQGETAST